MMTTEDIDIQSFQKLIRHRCGLSFNGTRLTALRENINSQVKNLGLLSLEDYYSLITQSQAEFERLLNLITINETYFMRESAHYKALTSRILPELMAVKPAGIKIRLFSAGCSTGEELYSMIIAVLECFGTKASEAFYFAGADIDRAAIEKARRAVYNKISFRNFPEPLKRKYFTHIDEDHFKVNEQITRLAHFETYNLLDTPLTKELTSMDVIFYRNVSIYFDKEIQKRVFDNLAMSLNEGGYIFVSSVETFGHNLGTLSLIEMDGLFVFKKLSGTFDGNMLHSVSLMLRPVKQESLLRKKQIPSKNTGTNKRKPSAEIAETVQHSPDTLLEEAGDLIKEKKYKEAIKTLELLIKEQPNFNRASVLKGVALFNLRRMDEARDVFQKTLDTERWSVECYLFLGMIAQHEGHTEEARRRFKEAVYANPSAWIAHYYLAQLYHHEGQLQPAQREYRAVTRILTDELHHGQTAKNLGTELFTISFRTDDILHLCRHNLEKINRSLK
ncbi:MAG: tetratricopeptide repeat protein [Nitrospirae bacterium YQR-1]